MFGAISGGNYYDSPCLRTGVVEQEVRKIAKEVNFDEHTADSIQVLWDNQLTASPACAVSYGQFQACYLSPFWFFDWKRLPQELQLTGPDDPRLEDKKFVQRFFDYISKEFQLPKQEITIETISALRFFVRLRQNPEKARQAFRSMIAHELGHLHHQHSEKSKKFHCVVKRVAFAVCSIFTILGAISLCLISPPFLPLVLLIPIMTLGGYRLAALIHERRHENQADRFAAKRLVDASEGADYGFSCAIQTCKDIKKSRIFSVFTQALCQILFFGDEILPLRFSHGSFISRINRMKKIASQNKKQLAAVAA